MALNWAVGGPASAPLPLPLLGFFTPQCVPLSLNAYSDTLARRWRISMARIFLKSSGPKPNPFGTPNFAPSVAMSRGTTFLELPVTTDNGIALGGSSHETGGHPDIMIQFRSDLHRTERQIAVIGWRPLGNKTLSPLTLDDY